MKFGSKGPVKFESGPNLTPLVDVVMVILIFLMLVGQFIGNEKYLQQRSGILEQAADVVASASDRLDQTVTINVRRTGERFTAVIDGKGVSDADSVAALLSQKRAAFQASGLMPATDDPSDTEGANERITIAISPDRSVLHRDYMSVYDAALRAGFKKVTFTVQR